MSISSSRDLTSASSVITTLRANASSCWETLSEARASFSALSFSLNRCSSSSIVDSSARVTSLETTLSIFARSDSRSLLRSLSVVCNSLMLVIARSARVFCASSAVSSSMIFLCKLLVVSLCSRSLVSSSSIASILWLSKSVTSLIANSSHSIASGFNLELLIASRRYFKAETSRVGH